MNSALQNQLQQGFRLLQTRQLDQAQAFAQTLLEQFPDSPEAYLYAVDTATLSGNHKGALAVMDEIIARRPEEPALRVRKAELLVNDGQRTAARAIVREVADQRVQNEALVLAIARLLSQCQDLDGTRAWLLGAAEQFPESRAVLAELAFAEFQLNLPSEADQHLAALLELEPFHPGALRLRSMLSTQTEADNHVADLQDRLAKGPEHPALVASACFALSKEYEDLGQFDESFGALQRGAAAHRSTLNYDSAAELAAHEEIRQGFTKAAFEALAPGYDDPSPIFIVGMPRTGTTLVERLLSTHSQVVSIGEFPDFPVLLRSLGDELQGQAASGQSDVELSLALDFHELGRRYVNAARDLAGESPRFVDKLPYNFLYGGYLQAALPQAKLINLTRDPLDTCYAVYKTQFFSAYPFSYDLDELADYLISYRRHIAHWQEVLPAGMLDVSYEALVQNPEAEARRIVDWCGLDWEPAVLDFHRQETPSTTASAMQVRRPFYTESIGAWRRAGNALDGVRRKFEAAGLLEPGDQPTA